MRVLFSTGHSASRMLPPSLSDDQVICGPDWSDERAVTGRVRSLATPVGGYDLKAIAAKLPGEQQPDVVVCLVDSSWRNLPRNLAAFTCPRVLLVSGTHRGKSPLSGMLRYLAAERFDRIVLLDGRHHATFFLSAGFRNLYWFPGLLFPHSDATVHAARKTVRESRIAFAEHPGEPHPHRARLLGALTARAQPFAARALASREALEFYGTSLLGLNVSCNGEFNLRVFEALAAGAGLLTDRLAPESGMEELFNDGLEVSAFGDAVELGLLAHNYLTRPADARALSAAGAEWFDEHLSECRRRLGFLSLVFDGEALPEFEFKPRELTRVYFGGQPDRLRQGLQVYEQMQELHRTQETVHVALDRNAPDDLVEIYSTLPRVGLSRLADGYPTDLALFPRTQPGAVVPANAKRLWCYDAEPEDFVLLDARFVPEGFVPASQDAALFVRPEAASAAAPAKPHRASERELVAS